jgi:hypothetical protein
MDLQNLKALRALGVKSVDFDVEGKAILSCQFFEMSENERLAVAVDELDAQDKAAMMMLDEKERAEAMKRRNESLLYHSG